MNPVLLALGLILAVVGLRLVLRLTDFIFKKFNRSTTKEQ